MQLKQRNFKIVATAKQIQRERDAQNIQRALPALQDRLDCQYKEGDYVLIERAVGRPSRLNKLRRGPFKVVRIQNRNVIVQDLVTNVEQPPVDSDRIVPFYYNSTVINPEVVAATDKDMFIVVEI